MNEWLINEQIKLHNPVADGELEVNWWKVKAPSVCARYDQVKEKKNRVFSTCYSSYKISITALTFQVAVKVVPKKAVLVREFVRKNVRREAIVLQKLSHPNIIKMYEVMETENSYYLVLEYADCGEFIKYLSIK